MASDVYEALTEALDAATASGSVTSQAIREPKPRDDVLFDVLIEQINTSEQVALTTQTLRAYNPWEAAD